MYGCEGWTGVNLVSVFIVFCGCLPYSIDTGKGVVCVVCVCVCVWCVCVYVCGVCVCVCCSVAMMTAQTNTDCDNTSNNSRHAARGQSKAA